MPAQDTSQIKEKIISFIKRNGPTLPVHIAKDAGLSILFTSAFLSELLSEKRIKTSHLRIGSSPLYFIPGQENTLEKFANYLKSKEKEAFNLLKEKSILKDSEQEPAIRVALRELKDFAVPFNNPETGELLWRYFTIPRGTFLPKKREERTTPSQEELDIFDKPKEKSKQKRVTKPKRSKKKNTQKENNFFMRVKNTLNNQAIEFIDILQFNKNELILKVKEQGKENVLVAFNKKRIGEKDLIKASKKAHEFGSQTYTVLGTGQPLKKTEDLINALKGLDSIKKLEENP